MSKTATEQEIDYQEAKRYSELPYEIRRDNEFRLRCIINPFPPKPQEPKYHPCETGCETMRRNGKRACLVCEYSVDG